MASENLFIISSGWRFDNLYLSNLLSKEKYFDMSAIKFICPHAKYTLIVTKYDMKLIECNMKYSMYGAKLVKLDIEIGNEIYPTKIFSMHDAFFILMNTGTLYNIYLSATNSQCIPKTTADIECVSNISYHISNLSCRQILHDVADMYGGNRHFIVKYKSQSYSYLRYGYIEKVLDWKYEDVDQVICNAYHVGYLSGTKLYIMDAYTFDLTLLRDDVLKVVVGFTNITIITAVGEYGIIKDTSTINFMEDSPENEIHAITEIYCTELFHRNIYGIQYKIDVDVLRKLNFKKLIHDFMIRSCEHKYYISTYADILAMSPPLSMTFGSMLNISRHDYCDIVVMLQT